MVQVAKIQPVNGWTLGIDISKWQGEIDWGQLPANVQFVYMRASNGMDPDPMFEANAAACPVPWGAYHYAEPGTVEQAVAAAQMFANMVAGQGSLPPALDFEEAAKGEKASNAASRALAALAAIEEGTKRQAIVYTLPAFIELLTKYGAYLGPLGNRQLWLAHYTQSYERAPRVPPPWDDWRIWQASGGKKVSKNAAQLGHVDVDVNWLKGSVCDLVKLGR